MAIRETNARHEALGLDEDDLRRMHYHMLLARRVDERSWILNRQGKAAFVISCQGQEGAQVGAAYNLRPGYDYLYPYYRDSRMTMLLGQTPRDQFLSLLGKEEDPNSGGRQMPGHYCGREQNIVTASAPVGVQYPQAAGTALAFKMRGEDGVVLVCGGEASTSGGDWHEAMNFAGIHDLPVVFFVENNVYAISVPVKFQVAGSIAKRAEGYGFPGHEVDGNDVLAVYEAAKEAFERARAGEGPDAHRGQDLPDDRPLLRRRRPAGTGSARRSRSGARRTPSSASRSTCSRTAFSTRRSGMRSPTASRPRSRRRASTRRTRPSPTRKTC